MQVKLLLALLVPFVLLPVLFSGCNAIDQCGPNSPTGPCETECRPHPCAPNTYCCADAVGDCCPTGYTCEVDAAGGWCDWDGPVDSLKFGAPRRIRRGSR